MVNEAEEAARAVTGFASEPRGLVRITAPPDLGDHELPRVIAKITRQHRGVSSSVEYLCRLPRRRHSAAHTARDAAPIECDLDMLKGWPAV